jgi:hypothetical protein
MRKKIAVYVGLLLFTTIFSFSLSAKQVEKEIKVGEFNSVTLECNAVLNIKIGSENKLVIKAKDTDFQNIKTVVENNNLELLYEKQGKEWWNMMGVFARNNEITFNLTVKNLNNVTLTSNGDIKILDDIKSDNFGITSMGSGNIKSGNIVADSFKANTIGSGSIEAKSILAQKVADICSSGSGQLHFYDLNSPLVDITASGSSTMNIRKIKTSNLHTVVLGSGTVSVQGTAESQSVKVDGTGRYYGGLLISNVSKVKALGASNIEINVKKEVSVDVFGSSMVNVDGSPNVASKNVYGSGAMIMQTGTSMSAKDEI